MRPCQSRRTNTYRRFEKERLKVPAFQGRLACAARNLTAAEFMWEKALGRCQSRSALLLSPHLHTLPARRRHFMGARQRCSGGRWKTPSGGLQGLMSNSTASHEERITARQGAVSSPTELRVAPPAAGSPRVNGTQRQPPRPVPGRQLPPALLSPAHMQPHTAPSPAKRY